MSLLMSMIANFVYYFLGIVQLAMFARAILSWIAPDADGALINFLYGATEPFVGGIRKLLARFSDLDSFPIDISFFIAAILIEILRIFISYAIG